MPGDNEETKIAGFVVSVPLAVPRGFSLDPDKPVTSSTADFRWEAVREDSVLLNGVFTGYKVSHFVRH